MSSAFRPKLNIRASHQKGASGRGTGRRRYALTGVLLSLALLFSFARPFTADAATVTEESIREKEQQIENAKSERDQINASLSDIQAMKLELEATKSNLLVYVAQLDATMTELQERVDELKLQIENKEEEIRLTEEELKEAERVQQEQYEAMKARIQYIYEHGDPDYLELFMKSASFGDMLNKATYIEELSAYDQRKLEEYRLQKEYVRLTKEALEEEKATLDATKASVEAEEANIQALLDEKAEQIRQVESQIASQQASIEQYEAQLASRNSAISALESQVAAEKALLEEQNRRHFGGGQFTWPCPGYSRISDDYGYRTHPIYGDQRFHSGLDLAASTGTPILAAADGDVVAAAYEASMGNYIMIDHGDSLYTIYMHCSALYVSKGQSVSAGQKIGAVGSTGNSTGPHLHFSVRLNGKYVSPWNYL